MRVQSQVGAVYFGEQKSCVTLPVADHCRKASRRLPLADYGTKYSMGATDQLSAKGLHDAVYSWVHCLRCTTERPCEVVGDKMMDKMQPSTLRTPWAWAAGNKRHQQHCTALRTERFVNQRPPTHEVTRWYRFRQIFGCYKKCGNLNANSDFILDLQARPGWVLQ